MRRITNLGWYVIFYIIALITVLSIDPIFEYFFNLVDRDPTANGWEKLFGFWMITLIIPLFPTAIVAWIRSPKGE